MKYPAREFLLKAGMLAAPLGILLITYVWLDPFKVLRRYDAFFHSGQPSAVTLNMGYVSTETFLHYSKTVKYDSIILGNSRSRFYTCSEWGKYIQSSHCFHFDGSGESLFGVERKVRFLKDKIDLRHALIILDSELLMQASNVEAYLTRQHPVLTGESPAAFQLRFLKAYLSPKFFIPYIDHRLTGKIRPYMQEAGINDTDFLYDAVSNEMTYETFETMIRKNKEDYYRPRMNKFFPRDGKETVWDAVVGEKQRALLNSIREVFSLEKTDYRIVISPLYNQKKIHPQDLAVLRDVFGEDNVFDFSGRNEMTESIYNYYEWSHYRPHVCAIVLNRIYSPR